MRAPKRITVALVALAILSGCGTSEPAKPKEAPSRPVQATFNGVTPGEVRTRLMVVCTEDKFQITSTQPDILCTKNIDNYHRERLIEQAVDNEFATNFREGMKFVISQKSPDVGVVATSFTQYTMLGGFTTGAELKTRDLVDDASFTLLTEVIRRAGGTYQ